MGVSSRAALKPAAHLLALSPCTLSAHESTPWSHYLRARKEGDSSCASSLSESAVDPGKPPPSLWSCPSAKLLHTQQQSCHMLMAVVQSAGCAWQSFGMIPPRPPITARVSDCDSALSHVRIAADTEIMACTELYHNAYRPCPCFYNATSLVSRELSRWCYCCDQG